MYLYFSFLVYLFSWLHTHTYITNIIIYTGMNIYIRTSIIGVTQDWVLCVWTYPSLGLIQSLSFVRFKLPSNLSRHRQVNALYYHDGRRTTCMYIICTSASHLVCYTRTIYHSLPRNFHYKAISSIASLSHELMKQHIYI